MSVVLSSCSLTTDALALSSATSAQFLLPTATRWAQVVPNSDISLLHSKPRREKARHTRMIPMERVTHLPAARLWAWLT